MLFNTILFCFKGYSETLILKLVPVVLREHPRSKAIHRKKYVVHISKTCSAHSIANFHSLTDA